MLPFRTSIIVSIIEFFSVVLLHVVYALNQFGWEQALFISIGFLPVLLTLLLYRTISNENAIVRCFYVTMTLTSYIISAQLDTLGMLIMIYMAEALIIALFVKKRIFVEYFAFSFIGLLAVGIFQTEEINIFFSTFIYIIYLLFYCFAMITLLMLIIGVESYKAKMEEKNKEAQEALEAKSNFLANMSHEIRTPMNAISGMAQLLSQKNFQKEEKEYIATIQKSSESLLSIINEILDFSKIDSGNMEILEDEYHFNSLIHDVLSIIEFRMRNKSVRLIIDIDPRIPRVLIGDQLRIRQVLINILNNAVNFTHRGHIRLHIIWQKNSEQDGCLEVEVEDTGIGISEENMKKLFRAFGQIDTRKNRNVEGTGLGLVISKSLLNKMGGDIWVESILNEGSVFSFRLPQKVKDGRPSNYEANHDKVFASNDEFKITFRAPSAKVMVVDDNKVNLQVASELMKKFGFEPVLVESGLEAVNRIEENLIPYDMIFMDHMMPFMDGVEATQKIRAIQTEYAQELPIVALTANAIKGVERQFKEAGMNDYISKPIHMKQLSDILEKWIPISKQVRIMDGKEIAAPRSYFTNPMLKKEAEEKKDILDLLKGISIEDGLRNCGGNKNAYIRVLSTFAASNLLAGLEEYLQKEDAENYGIIAHSIKGACRNIGALEVGDIAYDMELAGQNKDIEYIKENHEEFARMYGDTLRLITKALIEHQS